MAANLDLLVLDRTATHIGDWLQKNFRKDPEGRWVHLVYKGFGGNLTCIPVSCLEHVTVRSIKDYGAARRTNRRENPAELFEARRIVLKSSSKTLATAELDTALLAQSIFTGVPYKNLEELQLTINFQILHDRHPALMNKLFSSDARKTCFPKLQSLSFIPSSKNNEFDFVLLTGLAGMGQSITLQPARPIKG